MRFLRLTDKGREGKSPLTKLLPNFRQRIFVARVFFFSGRPWWEWQDQIGQKKLFSLPLGTGSLFSSEKKEGFKKMKEGKTFTGKQGFCSFISWFQRNMKGFFPSVICTVEIGPIRSKVLKFQINVTSNFISLIFLESLESPLSLSSSWVLFYVGWHFWCCLGSDTGRNSPLFLPFPPRGIRSLIKSFSPDGDFMERLRK